MRLPSAAFVTLAACYQPSFDPCAVRCAAGDECPGETSCAADGFCHHAGEAMCEPDAEPPDMAPAPDMGPDAAWDPPTARLVSIAFNNSGSSTLGMSTTDYAIDTTGIADGDLVLFIASVDNGSGTVWPDPVAPGFTTIAHQFYGPDGQSFVVAWKVADGEPATYGGTYGPGINSAACVITLVAVTGASTVGTPTTNSVAAATDPVPADSPGIVTSVADSLVMFISGADWMTADGLAIVSPPTGYTELFNLGDHGDNGFQWSSIEVATAVQHVPGATGALSATFDSGIDMGGGFTVVVAIPPT